MELLPPWLLRIHQLLYEVTGFALCAFLLLVFLESRVP